MMKDSLVRRILTIAALVSVVLGMTLIWSEAAKAMSNDASAVLAQVSPYQPQQLTNVNLPSWAEPFEPVASLPLWAQAALTSALLVGAFFAVSAISRWVWGRFFEGAEGNSP